MQKSKSLVLIVVAFLALTLTGCGKLDRWWASQTGDASTICKDGIYYLQFTSGASVKYDKVTKLPQECK